MSPPEAVLWNILRMRPAGLKFRRQHPLGKFVLDFYCPSAKLAIEVDGIGHGLGNNPQRDVQRDAWIRARGIAVFRLLASDVLADPEMALRSIIARCGDR